MNLNQYQRFTLFLYYIILCILFYYYIFLFVFISENADSSTIHAVTFLRTDEVLTVNSIGQLKLWDLRQQGNEPAQILSL